MIRPAAVTAFALAALTAMAGCSGEDATPPAPGASASSVPIAAIECPDGLMAPLPDSPATEPASRTPRLGPASAAVLCVYEPRPATGGPGEADPFGWTLSGAPRPLDQSDVEALNAALPGLTPADPDRACRRDLGPEALLLMQVRGGVLGMQIEWYGCRDTRLVIDPHDNPAGTSTDDLGSVAGILTPPPELLALVERVGALN